MVAAQVQTNKGGVAWTSQHGVTEWAHGIGGQVEVGSVQWDDDGHDGVGSQPPAVHSGQAEAVEQAKALHLTAATRVAILDGTGLSQGQQRQTKPQEECHYVLEREIICIQKPFEPATPTDARRLFSKDKTFLSYFNQCPSDRHHAQL